MFSNETQYLYCIVAILVMPEKLDAVLTSTYVLLYGQAGRVNSDQYFSGRTNFSEKSGPEDKVFSVKVLLLKPLFSGTNFPVTANYLAYGML